MNNVKAEQRITGHFRQRTQKDDKIHNACMLVHSDRHGIHLKLAEGTTGGVPAHPDQPYYIASVSKLFTAVLIGMLVEQGELSFDDPISMYVDQDLLRGLHIYKGKDYTDEIRIRHLLNHTSGLHDFMEDKPKQGKSMIDLILDEPTRLWTPQESIEWAKRHLTVRFPPGKRFHYSDTGYHLLGFIVERVTAKPFHEVLRQYIFGPLAMIHSYFGHYSEPVTPNEHPVASLYVRNVNIIRHRSLSVTFAGGGVVSTTEDLLKFMQALVAYRLVRETTLAQMKQDRARFFPGIDYGHGIMNIKTVPLLMPARYNAWGNAGSTGSYLFYHPGTDTYLIGSMNHFGYGSKGIRFMLQTVDQLLKEVK